MLTYKISFAKLLPNILIAIFVWQHGGSVASDIKLRKDTLYKTNILAKEIAVLRK